MAGDLELPDDLEPLNRFEWERALLAADIPRNAKLVGLILAVYANGDDGTNAHPGNPRLVAWSGLSDRAVERQLALMRDKGLIFRTEKGHGNEHYRRADCYRLTAPVDYAARGLSFRPDPAIKSQNPPDVAGSGPVDDSQNPPDVAGSTSKGEVLNPPLATLNPPLATPEPATGDGLPSRKHQAGSSPRMANSSVPRERAEVEGNGAGRTEPPADDDLTFEQAQTVLANIKFPGLVAGYYDRAKAELGDDAGYARLRIRAAQLAKAERS
jgi:hypothetical protein